MNHRNYERIRRIVMDPSVLTRSDEPMQLASGEYSRDFIDGKHAVDDQDDLDMVGEAMLDTAVKVAGDFDAVGGLVLGAVPFTFAVAQRARCQWFLIRKEPKGRGTNLLVEGARLQPGTRVMLVDDIVTTGGSIRKAYETVVEAKCEVVFATTLVDRGDDAAEFFRSEGVPYQPMLTYKDIGIDPVGHAHRAAHAASTQMAGRPPTIYIDRTTRQFTHYDVQAANHEEATARWRRFLKEASPAELDRLTWSEPVSKDEVRIEYLKD